MGREMRTLFILWVVTTMVGLSACARAPNQAQLSTGEDSEAGLLRLATDFDAHGQNEAALPVYRRAVTVSGEAPSAYRRLGDACVRAGRIDEAIDAYLAALMKAPNDAEAELGLGTALVRKGDIEAGVDSLTKAAPVIKTAVAYDRLGVAQTLAGRLPEAEASFDSAVAVAPDDLDIRTNLAFAAVLGGHDEKAVATMRDVVKSPGAEIRHRRDFVVVLGMAGLAKGEKVVLSGMSNAEVRDLLTRAGAIRAMKSAKDRANAIGAIAG
jgi:Flp pilus assembly protein TadD